MYKVMGFRPLPIFNKDRHKKAILKALKGFRPLPIFNKDRLSNPITAPLK